MPITHGAALDPAFIPPRIESHELAVLVSGGLDSAILLGDTSQRHTAVYPLYVRMGLHWESVELGHLERFLHALRNNALQPLHVLDQPVADAYRDHWSLSGRKVPDAASPDEAVYLPGRNVLLLAKALLWCHLRNIPAVALGSLASNPFPDATPAFFAAYEQVVNQAMCGAVRVLRPYAELSKIAVMQHGRDLPLELTFSCINPVGHLHCGRCNKCHERQVAFRQAGIDDRTAYHLVP